MKKCFQCGYDQLPDVARFCPICGSSMTVTAPVQEMEPPAFQGAEPLPLPAVPAMEPVVEPVEPAPKKKAHFSETLWFKDGAEGDPDDLGKTDMDPSLLQERYVPGKADIETRKRYSLTFDGEERKIKEK